jgi:hypothetical protein
MAMKKVILSSFLLLFVFIQITGCGSAKSDGDIRNIAYQYLNEGTKKTIIDWENAKVEEESNSQDYLVAGPNGVVSTKGKDIYKITFRTNNEAYLGPILVIMDKNTYAIIGAGLRD